MSIRDWQVSRSLEGFRVRLVEVPLWAAVVSRGFDRFCAMSGHVLCGGRTPDFLYAIPLGRPRRDDYGLVNSLGGGLYRLASSVLFVELNREVVRFETSVSDEVGKSLWGDDPLWDDEEDEDGGREEGTGAG